jgi:hypothetical protein
MSLKLRVLLGKHITCKRISSGKIFQWRKNQDKDFYEMKRNISQAPILILPNFHNPFEVETDASVYALVQAVKKWKHYLLGKETIIHTDHHPLQYLQAQSKIQQTKHYKWMGFLQQFHLVIEYKNGNKNKLENMLSRPPTSRDDFKDGIFFKCRNLGESY